MQIISLVERNLSKSLKEDISTLKKLHCVQQQKDTVWQSPEPSPALTQSYSDYWLFQVYCHPLSCCTHLLTGLQSSSFFNYCADFTYTFNTTYAKWTGNTSTAKFLRAPLVLSHPSCGTYQLVSSVLHLNPCKAETAFRQQPTTGNLSVHCPQWGKRQLKTISEWKQSIKYPPFSVWYTLLPYKSIILDFNMINTNLSWILWFLLAKMHSQSS